MQKLVEPMSDEELFSLPLELQQAVANQRLEGLELPREVILDSLRQMSDSKLNATESPKLFATEKKSRDIIVLLLE